MSPFGTDDAFGAGDAAPVQLPPTLAKTKEVTFTSDPTSNPSFGALVPQVDEVSGVDLDIAQVLRDLETPFDLLAVDAIRAAQRLGPAIVPGLIDLLRNATRGIREGIKSETNAPRSATRQVGGFSPFRTAHREKRSLSLREWQEVQEVLRKVKTLTSRENRPCS